MNNLIITGSAPCTLEDLSNIPFPHDRFDFMAIGLDAVDKYKMPIRYVATYHPAEIDEIRKRREDFGGNTDYEVISHEARSNVHLCIVDWWKPSGSSALLGVQAALHLGYHRIILCGCPLTGKNEKNGSYEVFRKGWEVHREKFKNSVRSMSGWTCELLGLPTEEWING